LCIGDKACAAKGERAPSIFYSGLMDLPNGLRKYDCVGVGAVAVVLRISHEIVVKYPRIIECERFQREVEFYRLLDSREPCPDIVECFLVLPNAIFLSYCSTNNLHQRFLSRQIRETTEDDPGRVIDVTAKDDIGTICRWLQQLVSATAFLEKLFIAHNDLHPRNLLLDKYLNMKLSDFDSSGKIGEDLPGAPAPYARVLNHGPNRGGFGLCGARTEQFAIGSILFFMLYGHEPYEDTCLSGDEVGNRFQDMRFPELGEDVLEKIVQKCWFARFQSMGALESEVLASTAEVATRVEASQVKSAKEKETIKELLRSGLF
jgi:serine/threonine protein kinase